MAYVTNVTKKGQTTIPVELREALGIEPEDQVRWVQEGNNLVLHPRKKVKDPLKKLAAMRFKASKTALKLCREAREDFW